MNTPTQTEEAGIVVLGGRRYMRDSAARLVPEDLVKPTDKLVDQAVRNMMRFAEDLSAQITRFRGHTFDDVGALMELLAGEYKTTLGGRKGNITLTSYDGLAKVQVAVADFITFGPELQVAKALVDECIASWSEDARDEIRALVNHAFDVDKEGRINRAALFRLRRVKIDDERWIRAMEAIGDAIRVIGSKTYVRFYRRPTPEARWEPVTIDLAAA